MVNAAVGRPIRERSDGDSRRLGTAAVEMGKKVTPAARIRVNF